LDDHQHDHDHDHVIIIIIIINTKGKEGFWIKHATAKMPSGGGGAGVRTQTLLPFEIT
jgi:hypothetical protein